MKGEPLWVSRIIVLDVQVLWQLNSASCFSPLFPSILNSTPARCHLLILRHGDLPIACNTCENYLPEHEVGRRADADVWDQKLQKQLY